jgi:hypothetical protein
MQSDSDNQAPEAPDAVPATAPARAPASAARSDAQRERLRQSQIIAAQVARARTAGGQPSDDEVARLVAEFHARGGQVTTHPEPEAPPLPEPDRGRPFARRAR